MAESQTHPPGSSDPSARGGLLIKDAVVEHVAEHAAIAVPGVVRQSSALSKVINRSLPRGEAVVAGDRIRARVSIAVQWPSSLSRTASAVRDEVAERLAAVTGLQVAAVDVAVAAVVVAEPSAASQRRVQ